MSLQFPDPARDMQIVSNDHIGGQTKHRLPILGMTSLYCTLFNCRGIQKP